MTLFHRKKNPSNELVDLLLNDKIDHMLNLDAILTLLIQKGVFTKNEFDTVKQAIRDTDEYRQIYRVADRMPEMLDPSLQSTTLSDKEIEDLLSALSENEVDLAELNTRDVCHNRKAIQEENDERERRRTKYQ